MNLQFTTTDAPVKLRLGKRTIQQLVDHDWAKPKPKPNTQVPKSCGTCPSIDLQTCLCKPPSPDPPAGSKVVCK